MRGTSYVILEVYMSIKSKRVKKVVTLTVGSVGMMLLGAGGMIAMNKAITPSVAGTQSTLSITQPKSTIPANQTPVDPKLTVAREKSSSSTPTPAFTPPSVVVSAPVYVEPLPPVHVELEKGYVMAQIVSVKPRYVTKTVPYESCKQVPHTVLVRPHRGANGGGAILGGVAGGLVGNQIGGGNGKIAATIGGTIVGAMVGNQMERDMNNRPEYRTVYETICKTRYAEKRVVSGYDVTYEYEGKTGKKFMKTRPKSDYIRLELAPVLS